MAELFQDILVKAIQSGNMPGRGRKSMKWYRETAQTYSKVNATSLRDQIANDAKTDSSPAAKTMLPGSLYMFNYSALHKKTLPYWDAFPLIFPFEINIQTPNNGKAFMGINLHYLPIDYRAKLMDRLYYDPLTRPDKPRFDDKTILKMNWEILKAFSGSKYVGPCVHMYLNKQVRGPIAPISPLDWNSALFLPTQRFQKATAQTVWADSIKKISGFRKK